MNRVTLSFFAAICLISPAFGTECSSGPGYRFPITCPGLLDPKKSNCCEIGGSFRCCDEEEFSRQDQEYTDDIEPALAPRYKRSSASDNEALSGIVIVIIVKVVIISLAVIICSCFFCPCCPCYTSCHRKPSNVTVVQPYGYPAGQIAQNNFCISPQSSQHAPTHQDLPPQYHQSAATNI